MRRPLTAWLLAAAWLAASAPADEPIWLIPQPQPTSAPAGATTPEQLRTLLGEAIKSARLVSQQDGNMVLVDLPTLQVRTFARFPRVEWFGGLSRPWWSRDGRQIIYACGGRCYVAGPDGGNQRAALPGTEVHEPSFWDDPATGERCIVYNTKAGRFVWPDDRGKAATMLYHPKSRTTRKLADFPFDSGLSLDGYFLAEGFPGLLVKDMRTGKVRVLFRTGGACHASVSPDYACRLMFLTGSHRTFSVSNRFGRTLWIAFPPPPGRAWHTPRFATHPDFATAVVVRGSLHKPVIIHLPTRKVVVLDHLEGNWLAPHLFLEPPPYLSPALDHVKTNAYAAQIAAAADWSALIRRFRADPDDEAQAAATKLEVYGRDQLAAARDNPEALASQAIYRELAEKYADHAVGAEARRRMDLPSWQDRLKARAKLEQFRQIHRRLRAAAGQPGVFSNQAFFERNRAVLVQMVALAADLRVNHRNSIEMDEAERTAFSLRLPDKTSEAANVRLVVMARAAAVSRPPTLQEIAPYDSAVTFIRWEVEKVLQGHYGEKHLLAAHWAIRDRRPAAAIGYERGLRLRLMLDLFDAHPELQDVPASRDADDFQLTAFWALETETPN